MTGVLVFKCRSCSKVYDAASSDDLTSDLVSLMTVGRVENRDFLARQMIHDCGDGSLGIADLVGGIPDKTDK